MSTHLNPLLYLCIMHGRQLVHPNGIILIMTDIHDDIAEPAELSPTERLGEEVTNHLIGWAVHNVNVSASLHVRNEEVSNIHVHRPLAARSTSIGLKQP